MKLGISLGEYGPRAGPARILDRAATAVELGLDCVWVSDRVVVPSTVETRYPYAHHDAGFDPVSAEVQHEALVTMAWAAAAQPALGVGVSVLALPLREPMLLARQLATLMAFAPGRITVGVGVGWMREEFAIAAPHTWEARGRFTDDYLALLQRLWTSEGDVAFEGDVYRSPAVRFAPRPRTAPRIEVGGNSRTARRRAARFADAWHAMQLEVEEIAEAGEELRTMTRDDDRGPVSITLRCSLDDTGADLPDAPTWHFGGTDARLADALGRYTEAGVESLVFDLQPDDDPAPHRDVLERVSEICRSMPGDTG